MYEEDVPGCKSENVRKLPYHETGTRFTHPEPFPQLDDIFNLNRARCVCRRDALAGGRAAHPAHRSGYAQRREEAR